MSKQRRDKFTAPVTSEKRKTKNEKPGQDKPFVQFEAKLSEAELDAIAAAGRHNNGY